jgi:hypothetical protein
VAELSFAAMRHLRRIRAFLGLRQADIERAVGIPAYRIAAAENGRLRLNRVEQALLKDFLSSRLRSVPEVETLLADFLSSQRKPSAVAADAGLVN